MIVSKYPPPISHWAVGDYYRIPMIVDGDDYVIVVGDNKIRMYTDETLPDFVKALITMIHAFKPNLFDRYIESAHSVDSVHKSVVHSIYDNNQDRRLDEIGWQLTKDFYMLILTTKQLFGLIGNNNHGNTREENKRQGEAGTG